MKITRRIDTAFSDDSTDVGNYSKVLDFICANKDRLITLTRYQGDNLEKLFGKENARFKGSEYKFKVWILEFESEVFELFSNSDKGLCISIRASLADQKSEVCKRFLKELERLLKECE